MVRGVMEIGGAQRLVRSLQFDEGIGFGVTI